MLSCTDPLVADRVDGIAIFWVKEDETDPVASLCTGVKAEQYPVPAKARQAVAYTLMISKLARGLQAI